MLKKRFKLNSVLTGIFALFVVITLVPVSVHAAPAGRGRWMIDGFVRNNTGVWLENWDTSLNNHPLATCRNWFRLNLNGKIHRNMKLKAEVLAIYEPEYSRERHGVDGVEPIDANYYNYFDFRELRLDWRMGRGHTLRIGRQIVNWGESISARVGDVINPVDMRFELGFTNLEDTRMPIWMVRGLHQFITQKRAFAVDWVFAPYVQPDRYRVNRIPSNIGHTNTDGSFIPGPRFGAMPESLSHMIDETGQVPYFATVVAPPATFGAVPARFAPLPIIGAPFNNMWQSYDAATAWFLFTGGANPAELPLWADGQYFMFPPTSAIFPNATPTDYPDGSLDDARWGFKLSTTFAGIQTGVYFWDHNTFDGGVFRLEGLGPPVPGIAPLGTLNVRLTYPREKIYGFFANKNFNFGVLRMDVAYRPNKDYNTLEQYDFLVAGENGTGIVEKDYLKVQFGINKDVMIYSLNETSPFSFIGEYVGEFILDSDTDQISVASYYLPLKKDTHTLMASVSTNYGFGKYNYGLTVLHNFSYGGNGLIQPTFTFAPSWMNNRWRFTLMYAGLYGPDYSYPYGLAKEKDMVVLTTQFSFP